MPSQGWLTVLPASIWVSDRLAVLMATAKATPTFTFSPVGFSRRVLMPITSPWQLSSGPPELPGGTAASGWVISRIGLVLGPELYVRWFGLTITCVCVPPRLDGFP